MGKNGTIIKTEDAGETWTAEESGVTTTLWSVFYPSLVNKYVSGENGVILRNTVGVGINEVQPTSSLKIYPNPAAEKITIVLDEMGNNMSGTVSVFGMTGQELIREQVQSSKVELNVGSLSKGIYFITWTNNENADYGKFVKE